MISYRYGFLLLCVSCLMVRKSQAVQPYFEIRSQGADATRKISTMIPHMHSFASRKDDETMYGTLFVNIGFSRSFGQDAINKKLFGSFLVNDDTIGITGSQVANRTSTDWLADYFYLPTDYSSVVRFDPSIKTTFVDFSWYLGLDQWCRDLYLWVWAPLVVAHWQLNVCETDINPGGNAHAPGYFAPTAVQRNQLLDQFLSFAQGAGLSTIANVAITPLERSRISNRKTRKVGVADIQFGVGWDFCHTESYGVSVALQASAPVGTEPRGQYLFEPVIGNSHLWEFGMNLQGAYHLWQRCHKSGDNVQGVWVYGHVAGTHLFKNKQKRVFDLKGRPWSRFILAERLGLPSSVGNDSVLANAQFQSEFSPLANITALDVDVYSTIQADALLALSYIHDAWTIDFGYNFWGRSRERISLDPTNPLVNNVKWAIKGDAHVFGFLANSVTAVALSATQNDSTIQAGKNMPAQGSTDSAIIIAAQKNPNIDAPQPAFNASTQPLEFAPNIADSVANRINTSINPVFIRAQDLDIDGAALSGMSSKLFAAMTYTCSVREGWLPYFGLGVSSEWVHGDGCAQNNRRMGCSQWSVWLKGGVSF
jgi:hypothetical protein